MAVIEDPGPDRPEAGTGFGRIEIDDRCVTLDRDGERMLLVWRPGDVRWSGSTKSITFTGPVYDAPTDSITLRDGDVIAAGGATLIQDEDSANPPTSDAWIAEHTWVAEPDPRCLGVPWLVGSLQGPSER
jgi:hypothetical protein